MRSMSGAILVSVIALTVGACASPGAGGMGQSETAALSSTGVFQGLSGKCLDAGASTASGTQARLWDCNGSAAQQWTVNDAGQIVSSASGKCLDVSGGTAANGTPVIVWECNGGANQKWTLQGNLVVGLAGKCLDVAKGNTANGAAIVIWDCRAQKNQQWTFQTSSSSTGGTTTSPAPTDGGTTTTSPAPTSRDALKWPFASSSIWNMPIGSAAVYQPTNLADVPGGDEWAPMPNIDDEHIVLRPSAPLTDIYYNDAGWTGANRCGATGGLLVQVPMPTDYVVPSSGGNDGSSFLMPDGRTIVQTQPLARCTAGGIGTSIVKFPAVDIYGDGATGAHGGSGLSAIGGSLRVGELRPGGQGPRHALKINVYAKGELVKCATRADCYRWPAITADSYAVGWYGTVGTPSPYMKMGSLLAIPSSVALTSLGLETEPGKMLAWTLQSYGAHIVDDTYGAGFDFSAEKGPDGSFRAQFQSDWGYPVNQRVNDATPWVRDVTRIRRALRVVDNNGPTSIGGGGTPLQPLAPAL